MIYTAAEIATKYNISRRRVYALATSRNVGKQLSSVWVFRRPFRVVDRQKHCWELAEEFDDVMGKPWCERYQYPKITMFTEQAGNPYYEYK